MHVEPRAAEERPDLEKDLEAWTLPRSPMPLSVPPLEHWPERKGRFEAGLAELEHEPAAQSAPLRFETHRCGHPGVMGVTRAESSRLPTLVFVRRRQCGASRKMESLVAWIKVTRKRQLRVLALDADRHPEALRQLRVRDAPALVLMKDGRAVGRLEGRSTGRQIDALIREHVRDPDEPADAPQRTSARRTA